jgi:hypothetical protein
VFIGSSLVVMPLGKRAGNIPRRHGYYGYERRMFAELHLVNGKMPFFLFEIEPAALNPVD